MRRRSALAALPALALAAAALACCAPRAAAAAAIDMSLANSGAMEHTLIFHLSTPPGHPVRATGPEYRVRVLESGPSGDDAVEKTPVLLLHGASFDANTWARLGTLRKLGEAGHPTVAVDLPGAGGTRAPGARVPLLQRGLFVAAILDSLGWRTAHVVAPSASGRYALPFVLEEPQRVASFVPIGAVGLDGALARDLAASASARALPTLLVWGEKDLPNSARATAFTDTFTNARKVVLQGAGHACYNDSPDEFHAELLAWLASPSAAAGAQAAAAKPAGDLRA